VSTSEPPDLSRTHGPEVAESSWYVRSLAPRDVHRGVLTDSSVRAVCGTEFFPQLESESGQVHCCRLPQSGQVCPACLAQTNGHVAVIPATCSRHADPAEILELVIRGLGGSRIELASHPGDGCVLTVDATLVFDLLGTWLG
jgi:hypothetical protein